MEKIKSIFKGVYFSFSIFLGVIGMYDTYNYTKYKVIIPQSWIETECIVTYKNLEEVESGGKKFFKIIIKYKYIFNDQLYENSTFNIFDKSYNVKTATAIIKKYSVGKSTVCYVDPKDPTKAVIERKIIADHLVILVIGIACLIFFIIGTVGLFLIFKNKGYGK